MNHTTTTNNNIDSNTTQFAVREFDVIGTPIYEENINSTCAFLAKCAIHQWDGNWMDLVKVEGVTCCVTQRGKFHEVLINLKEHRYMVLVGDIIGAIKKNDYETSVTLDSYFGRVSRSREWAEWYLTHMA